MWSDNETSRDFLNFSGVAETVAEIIVQANGRPISIGVSGAWGVGKSSMIQLIRESLVERQGEGPDSPFVFVQFNAWLYQGYDDARAALMEVIASTLDDEAGKRRSGLTKAKELLKRVNWLRAAKLTANSALAISLGIPPTGLIGSAWKLGKKFWSDDETNDKEDKGTPDKEEKPEHDGLLNPKQEHSPPREIQALRNTFEALLEEMGVTVIVLIDDLDRCLPETTISTLEAIRHFLFLRNAAFVIAADTTMIKHAVKKHFEGVTDENLVTSYFDKLIQVPIQVPQLGTQEVRAYLMLLFAEVSTLNQDTQDVIQTRVIEQLRQSWQGKRVDRAFMQTLLPNCPPELVARFDTAEKLAPIMTASRGIAGNPRLIKRFLNALSIRMAISTAQGVGVDEAVLAKMLLFERLGNAEAYARLLSQISNSESGKPTFLAEWEDKAHAGHSQTLTAPWDGEFVLEWLKLPPRLSDTDLRGALYVSREYAPIISPSDRLSSNAADVLLALLTHPEVASSHKQEIAAIPRPEVSIMMDQLLDRARQIQEWGVPPILDACLALCQSDPVQGSRLAAFLSERPVAQLQPDIVPKIGDEPWAADVFKSWGSKGADKVIMRAVNSRKS